MRMPQSSPWMLNHIKVSQAHQCCIARTQVRTSSVGKGSQMKGRLSRSWYARVPIKWKHNGNAMDSYMLSRTYLHKVFASSWYSLHYQCFTIINYLSCLLSLYTFWHMRPQWSIYAIAPRLILKLSPKSRYPLHYQFINVSLSLVTTSLPMFQYHVLP